MVLQAEAVGVPHPAAVVGVVAEGSPEVVAVLVVAAAAVAGDPMCKGSDRSNLRYKTDTPLDNTPIPSIEIITSSFSCNVKSLGGTMPVPVIRKQPTGNFNDL